MAKAEQNWEEPVLPGFDQPEAPIARVESARDVDDKTKVRYRRINAVGRPKCEHCLAAYHRGEQKGISDGSFFRTSPNSELPLCFLHKQMMFHEDQKKGLVK